MPQVKSVFGRKSLDDVNSWELVYRTSSFEYRSCHRIALLLEDSVCVRFRGDCLLVCCAGCVITNFVIADDCFVAVCVIDGGYKLR